MHAQLEKSSSKLHKMNGKLTLIGNQKPQEKGQINSLPFRKLIRKFQRLSLNYKGLPKRLTANPLLPLLQLLRYILYSQSSPVWISLSFLHPLLFSFFCLCCLHLHQLQKKLKISKPNRKTRNSGSSLQGKANFRKGRTSNNLYSFDENKIKDFKDFLGPLQATIRFAKEFGLTVRTHDSGFSDLFQLIPPLISQSKATEQLNKACQ